jgi:hypothetical protein
MSERLSHAQSLRVIGQNLGVLALQSFEVIKSGDEYVVSSDEFRGGQPRGFLSGIASKLLGRRELDIANPIRFTATEILRIDDERRMQRTPGSPRDRRDLSFMLRVIGDYLDRKNIDRFTIDWSKSSYNVRYDDQRESFSVEDLYNFGIRMYLRRANRFQDEGPEKS